MILYVLYRVVEFSTVMCEWVGDYLVSVSIGLEVNMEITSTRKVYKNTTEKHNDLKYSKLNHELFISYIQYALQFFLLLLC